MMTERTGNPREELVTMLQDSGIPTQALLDAIVDLADEMAEDAYEVGYYDATEFLTSQNDAQPSV